MSSVQSSPDQTHRLKRPRIQQACKRCREKKNKCTVKRPCPACVSAEEECVEWRPNLAALSSSKGSQNKTTDPYASFYNGSSSLPPPPLSRQTHPPTWEGLTRSTGSFHTETSTTLNSANPPPDRMFRLPFPFEAVHKNEQGFLRCLGASSGLGALQYLGEHRALGQAITQETMSLLAGLPMNSLDPSSWFTQDFQAPLQESTESVEKPKAWSFLTQELDHTLIQSLVRYFLRTTYQLWPTFLLSEFQTTFNDSEKRENPDFSALVVAVVAVAYLESSAVGHKDNGFATRLLKIYVDIRTKWPQDNWSSVTSIQSLFYLALFYYGCSGTWGVNAAHGFVDEAVRRCFDCGLHRSVDVYSDTFTPEEVEVRRRTLWAVYCGDKISAAYGRPVLLRLNDISVEEIDIERPEFTERMDKTDPSLRPHILANIRLYMIFERILHKVNMASCTVGTAIQEISRGPRRRKETVLHDDSTCRADHSPVNFDEELHLIDKYRTLSLPRVTSDLEDDNVYHRHAERLRTMTVFSKMFIYRHLLIMDNSDIVENQVNMRHASQVLHWSKELLASQRKMMDRGQFTDSASTCSYQISQTGRALLILLYLKSLAESSQQPVDQALSQSLSSFQLTIRLLRNLSMRFDASHRSLDILITSAERLGIQIDPTSHGETFNESLDAFDSTGASNRDWIHNLPLSSPFVLTLSGLLES